MILVDPAIIKALNAGEAWTAKWLADCADRHEGQDTDHLVSSAKKALVAIMRAKELCNAQK